MILDATVSNSYVIGMKLKKRKKSEEFHFTSDRKMEINTYLELIFCHLPERRSGMNVP